MNENIILHKYSGFFLIELLISIAILSFISLIITKFHCTVMQAQFETGKYLEAVNIAGSTIEEITAGFEPKPFKKGDFFVSFANLATTLTKDQNKLKEFKPGNLTVTWNSLSGKQRKLILFYGVIN